MPGKQITVWGRSRPGSLARITGVLAAQKANLSEFFALHAKGRRALR